MPIQTSMGGNLLDIRQGDRLTAPQFNGSVLQTVLANATAVQSVIAGRVFSITTNGQLVPGIKAGAADATGSAVPLYAFSGLDVNNFPASRRARGQTAFFQPAAPWNTGANAGNPFAGQQFPTTGIAGPFGCISHQFAGELATSTFDTTATYTPGLALTALATTATDQTLRGRIRPVSATTDVIVGYVAPAGRYAGPYGYDMLAFIPAYVPGTTVLVA